MAPILPTATTVTAVASQGAEIAGQTTSRGILGVAGTIVTAVNSVRTNGKTARALSRRVAEMATAVATSMGDTADSGADPQQLEALDSFRDALLDMQAALEAQGQQSYLSQILHQQRDTNRLVDTAERISNLFSVLMMRMTLQTGAMTAHLVSHFNTMAAEQQSKFSMSLADTSIREPAAAHIPPRPALYFGRSMETQAVVDVILGTPAEGGRRVAILGGPGMGKTTLALSALHYPTVAERFGARRFFVPCDAAEGHSTGGCLLLIAKVFGVAVPDPKMLRHNLREVIGSEPLVLVLDNFESAWEAAEQRKDAEEALQFLAGMPDLTLIVTLRGTERPQGISWTRPFLPPLTSLSDTAAKQTFVSIADVPDADFAMITLLSHLDNVPLAVVLLANLAQYESTDVLLDRWNALQTSMLVRGRGTSHVTSLDVSITLSIRSPRMQAVPSAQTLLRLLSLLPEGADDSDLLRWDVDSAQQALSVLLQTSLATRHTGQRVHVLAPIRSFMLLHHPPSHADILPVYRHYFGLVALAGPSTNSAEDAELFAAVSAELANIESVVQYGLQHQQDCVDDEHSAVKAVVSLCILCHQTGMGSAADFLPRALPIARAAGSDALCAELLFYWALLSFTTSAISGDPKQLATEARELHERVGNEAGILETSVFLTYFLPAEAARAEAERLFVVAEARQDRRTMARCLQQTAFALVRAGDLRGAITTHERVLSILQHGGVSDRLAGVSGYRIALLTSALGDMRGAVQRFEEALQVCEASGYAIGAAMCRGGLADTLMNLGEPLTAVEHAGCVVNVTTVPSIQSYGRCLDIFVRANASLGTMDAASNAMERLETLALTSNTGSLTRSEVLATRGFLLQACGDPEQARILFIAARATLRASHDPREFPENVLEGEASILLELGDTELSLGQRDSAITAAVFSSVAFRSLDEQVKVIEAVVLLAESVADDESAKALVTAINPVIRRMGLSHALARGYLLSAEIASRRGNLEHARQCATEALQHFGDIETDWRLPRARALAQSS